MQIDQLIEKLLDEEETIVLELLEISTKDLVDTFWKRIEDKKEYLERFYG